MDIFLFFMLLLLWSLCMVLRRWLWLWHGMTELRACHPVVSDLQVYMEISDGTDPSHTITYSLLAAGEYMWQVQSKAHWVHEMGPI